MKALSMSYKGPKTESRLLGTWRSDRWMTMKLWLWRPGWPAKRRKRLAGIFGHLILRFTRKRLYSDYKSYREVQPYQVVASDARSVAIVFWSSTMKGWRIRHINFEENHYWIDVGHQREWFEKMPPAKSTSSRKLKTKPVAKRKAEPVEPAPLSTF